MLTNEDLLAIGALIKQELKQELAPINERLDGIDGRLDGIDERLDSIDERLDALEEDCSITREATNSIIEWIESYYGDKQPFPFGSQKIV